MEGIQIRAGNANSGEKDPFQFKVVKDGRHPLHQTGMADMIAALGTGVDIGPHLQNFKGRTPLLPAVGLDALAQGVPVLKTIAADRGRQGASQVVNRDLKAMDFFEGLDGPFGHFEMLHRSSIVVQ
jgi:hypothetical protein